MFGHYVKFTERDKCSFKKLLSRGQHVDPLL